MAITELNTDALNLQRPRVLVLEDEVLISIMMVDILDGLGCECVGPISSYREGLERAKTESFDAAILNLLIEGKKVYDVAQLLALRGIPFGFASGAEHDPIAQEWFDRPFLTKPYSADQVAHLLAKVLADTFNPLPAALAKALARSPVPVLSHPAQRRSSGPRTQ
jgi:CheY-like chemotaxis protein